MWWLKTTWVDWDWKRTAVYSCTSLQPCCNVTLDSHIRLEFQSYLFFNSVWIGPTAPASGSQGVRCDLRIHHLNWICCTKHELLSHFRAELFTVESSAVFEVNLFMTSFTVGYSLCFLKLSQWNFTQVQKCSLCLFQSLLFEFWFAHTLPFKGLVLDLKRI